MPKYLITTISTFISKYAIEADSSECAIKEWNRLDNGEYVEEYADVCEISQFHMGEEICRVAQVTDEQLVQEADEYLKQSALKRVRKHLIKIFVDK